MVLAQLLLDCIISNPFDTERDVTGAVDVNIEDWVKVVAKSKLFDVKLKVKVKVMVTL